jgi:sugar phosphate isomerase/epimerase
MTINLSAQPYTFDMSPLLKMYMDSFEIWKKNYEAFIKNAKDLGAAYGSDPAPAAGDGAASPLDAALLNWQRSGEEMFKRFAESQMEICRFFGARWEHYLKLPDQLSHCRSVTELGEVQSKFLSEFASDYMSESTKLAQPVADAMTNLAGGKAA